MAITDNLLAYWKLDEASGNPQDISGNGKHLTNVNTATFGTGKINNGTILNGVDQIHTIADTTLANLGDAFTVSCWFKANTLSAGQHRPIHASTSDSSVGSPYSIWLELASIKFETYAPTGGYSALQSSVSLSLNTWYHCVMVKESISSRKIYVNTTMNQSTTTRSGTPTKLTGVTLGCRDTGSSGKSGYFDGIIDEVGIWNRALTATEVSFLYNSGNGFSYPFSLNKSINGLAYESFKGSNGLVKASLKSINGVA